MFEYESYFNQYRDDNQLNLVLSFNMPAGYETANGTFDVEKKTVFINSDYLKEAPDYEKAFYLFHELRHSSQYLRPELFSSAVNRSIQYVIMYEGTCYKIIDGKYYECKLEVCRGADIRIPLRSMLMSRCRAISLHTNASACERAPGSRFDASLHRL